MSILRDSLVLLQDSLIKVNKTAATTAGTSLTLWGVLSTILDVVYKLGMVIIAIVNIFFARRLHKQQDVKEEEKNYDMSELRRRSPGGFNLL